MPNRTILNKYGLFVSLVHKVLKKRELERGDLEIINKARLVAALSSNHSWKTYRFLRNSDSFDKESIKEEIRKAYEDGWKEISENDIKEVMTGQIDEHALSMVLACGALDKDERREYKELLPRLLNDFIDGIEPIENREV